MSEESTKQQRWNQRYQEKVSSEPAPATILKSYQQSLSTQENAQRKALDLACGLGGNAIYLAQQGYQVTAVDYSDVALSQLAKKAENAKLSIDTVLCDLEKDGAEDFKDFDLVVVSYYLQRSLFAKIFSFLKPGGLLFYQTFSGEQVDGVGPQNPDFRLKQGELLSLCQPHLVLFYREDSSDCITEDCYRGEAMIVVKKN